MNREEIARHLREELTRSEDVEVAAAARAEIEQEEREDALYRAARERRGLGLA